MTASAIRALRRSLGLTQYDLSLLVDVCRETVVRWENDSGPRPQAVHRKRLEELAAAMDGMEIPIPIRELTSDNPPTVKEYE